MRAGVRPLSPARLGCDGNAHHGSRTPSPVSPSHSPSMIEGLTAVVSPVKLQRSTTRDARSAMSAGPSIFQPKVFVAYEGGDIPPRPHSAASARSTPASHGRHVALVNLRYMDEHVRELTEAADTRRKQQPFQRSVSQCVRAMLRAAPAADGSRPTTSMSVPELSTSPIPADGKATEVNSRSHQRTRPLSATSAARPPVQRPRSALARQLSDATAAVGSTDPEHVALHGSGIARTALYQHRSCPSPIGFSFDGDRRARDKQFAFSSCRVEPEQHIPADAAVDLVDRAATVRVQEEAAARKPPKHTKLSFLGEAVLASLDHPPLPVYQLDRLERIERGLTDVLAVPSHISGASSRGDTAAMRSPHRFAPGVDDSSHQHDSRQQSIQAPSRPQSATLSRAGSSLYEHDSDGGSVRALRRLHRRVEQSVARASSRFDRSSTTSALPIAGDEEAAVPFVQHATAQAKHAAARGKPGIVLLAKQFRREAEGYWSAHRAPPTRATAYDLRADKRLASAPRASVGGEADDPSLARFLQVHRAVLPSTRR
jgi:hypothetical protein